VRDKDGEEVKKKVIINVLPEQMVTIKEYEE
jgi:hypothetical protein